MPIETIARPNGKTYRPRKPGLSAHAWENDEAVWPDRGVIVFGTLDPDEAREYALQMCRYWYGTDSVTDEAPGWYRDGYELGHRRWVSDTDHGRPGVSFRAVDL